MKNIEECIPLITTFLVFLIEELSRLKKVGFFGEERADIKLNLKLTNNNHINYSSLIKKQDEWNSRIFALAECKACNQANQRSKERFFGRYQCSI